MHMLSLYSYYGTSFKPVVLTRIVPVSLTDGRIDGDTDVQMTKGKSIYPPPLS